MFEHFKKSIFKPENILLARIEMETPQFRPR